VKPAAPTIQPRRIDALDVARGAALIGMFGYHASFDLAYFGQIPVAFPFTPAMRLYSHAVACAFLFLAGVSAQLAHGAHFRLRVLLRRFLPLCAAAALVSFATYEFAPDEFIAFGILHCIAAASLLSMIVLRGPAPVGLVLAAALILSPTLFRLVGLTLAEPQWLGLSGTEPDTLDWRPLAPWGGATLLGTALARSALGSRILGSLAEWRVQDAFGRALAFGGRNSLAIYLLHQPIFIAVLVAILWATGRLPGY
jgi:uncharacterized membrane protein